ncbi:MAG: polyketide synthase dehydratase domain-containing protein, partial [Actinoallomurus sp.]
MGVLPAGGGMAAVQASEDEVLTSLKGFEDRLSVAAVNGPAATVVSGEIEALEEWLPSWAHRKTSRLRVSHAFHSALMEPMLAEFRRVAEGLAFSEPQIPVVSNVTGGLVSSELTDPQYWVDHVRAAVRFMDGIQALAGEGVTRFFELGPDGVLTAMARQCISDERDVVLASALRKSKPEAETFAGFLGQVHVAGAGVDWSAFYAGSGAQRVELPTYAFQRERYWLMPGIGAGDPAAAGLGHVDHPLLAGVVSIGDRDEWVFTGRVSQDTAPWTQDHGVLGMVVVPGTALVELAVAAGRYAGSPVLEELVLEAPLILHEHAAVQLQVTVAETGDDERREMAIYSRPEAGTERGMTCHARGTLATDEESAAPSWRPVEWPPVDAEPIDVDALYARLAEVGFDYGPAFQGLRAGWQDGDEVFADVALPDEHAEAARGFGIHPALFDASLHGGLGWLDQGGGSAELPFSWSGVRLEKSGASRVRVRIGPAGESALRVDIADEYGEPVGSVAKLAFRPVDQAQLESVQRTGGNSLFRVDWAAVPAVTQSGSDPARLAFLGEGADGTGERFADLDALDQALAEGAAAPDAVVAAVGAPARTG